MAFVNSIAVAPRVARARFAPSVSSFNGVRAFVVAKPRSAIMMNLETIRTRIEEETKKAEELSAKHGPQSQEAKVQWDVVEELEAEASHMRAQNTPTDPLEEYCKDAPEADECRTYED